MCPTGLNKSWDKLSGDFRSVLILLLTGAFLWPDDSHGLLPPLDLPSFSPLEFWNGVLLYFPIILLFLGTGGLTFCLTRKLVKSFMECAYGCLNS